MPISDEPERSGNPYAPPAVEDSMHAAVEGQTVSFAASDRLPKICLRCGVKKGTKRRSLRLQWVPPVAYWGLPLGMLPYLIIVSLTRRTAAAQLPFCDPCNATWVNTSFVSGGLIVAGTVAVIVAATVGFGGAPLAGGVLALVSTAAVTLAWRHFLPPKRLRLQRIEPDGIVIFVGVNSAAAEAIDAMYAEDDE